jgi:hypothetical protein
MFGQVLCVLKSPNISTDVMYVLPMYGDEFCNILPPVLNSTMLLNSLVLRNCSTLKEYNQANHCTGKSKESDGLTCTFTLLIS